MVERCAAVLALAVVLSAVPARRLEAQGTHVSPVSGTVEIDSMGSGSFVPLVQGGNFTAKAIVRTGRDGYALIRYADSSEVVVRPGSRVTVGGEGTDGVFVWVGKVLLRVKRLMTSGQERTHRTATTVAAVRGTEFGLAVDASGRTRVYVFEGHVAVANSQLPAPAIEVGPGLMTQVDEGKAPTTPRTFDSGEFERGVTGAVERGEDRAVEGGQAPAVLRYLAFADPDLDALENPAYLATGVTGLSAFTLGTAGGGKAYVDDGKTRTTVEDDLYLRGLGQAMARAAVGPDLRIGFFAQGDRGRDRAQTSLRAPGETLPTLAQDQVDWTVGEGRVLSSFTSGARALGLQVGHRRATFSTESAPAESSAVVVPSEARSDITTLSAGVRSAGHRTVGVSYEHSWVQSTTTSPADSLQLDGNVDAVQALVRAGSGGIIWAGWLRVERSASGEDRVGSDGAFIYREALSVHTARLGFGLGVAPAEGVVLSLDLAGAVANESAIQTNGGGHVIEDEEDLRWSGSVHLGTQITLSGPWRAELSVLHALEHIGRDFPVHAAGSPFTDVRAAYGSSAGAGLLYVGDRWTARYGVSSSAGSRPWVHSFLVAVVPR